MKPIELDDKTHTLGAPANWAFEIDGPCDDLEIKVEAHPNGRVTMSSAWRPDADELGRLMQGAPVTLQIAGVTHPAVSLGVGDRPDRDALFDGRGAPLHVYDERDETWPTVWNMPFDALQLAEAFEGQDQVASLADDVVLRAAVNVWDNAARLPGTFESVLCGVLASYARLIAPVLDPELSDEQLVEWGAGVGEALVTMVRQAKAIELGGWFAKPEANA